MKLRKGDEVVVVTAPADKPGLVGRKGTAYPTRDGEVEVEGLRDTEIDLMFGAPTFASEQLRKA